MTPARSVAASVVALGFASTLTAPMPAFAAPTHCQRIQHFAAQAGAEVLRINRLDLGPLAGAAGSPAEAAPSGKPRGDDSSPGPGRRTATSGDGDASSRSDAAPSAAGRSDETGPASGTVDEAGNSNGTSDSAGKAGAASVHDRQAGAGEAASGEQKADRAEPSRFGGGRGAAAPGPADAPSTGHSASGASDATRARKAANNTNWVRPDKSVPQSISGVGLGDARSVLIADGPINSAAAARILDGRVAGPSARNDLVVQQAPPGSHKPTVRRTGEKRFGPLQAGAGKLTAHARWNEEMTCDSTDAEAARSATELSRVSISGAGSDSLLRVPERISGRSDTALRQRDGRPESVASATITAGRMSLADGAVRIRVVRAPELRVGMSPTGKGEVHYRPAVIEVTGPNGQGKRLTAARDSVEVTLRDREHFLSSLPSMIEPIGPLPLPPIAGLPSPGEPESTPLPGGTGGTRMRISLGDVRQASKGNAIAARATAIRVSLIRDRGTGRTKRGYGPSPVVADLGIGVLEGAAVAPVPAGHGEGVSSGGVGAGLPITGPRTLSLALGGAALLIGGVGAVLLASRKRRISS